MVFHNSTLTVYMVTENWWPAIGGLENSLYALANEISKKINVNIIIPSNKQERLMNNGVTTTILPRDSFFEKALLHIKKSNSKEKIVSLYGYSYFDIEGQVYLLKELYKINIPTTLKIPTLGHTSRFIRKEHIAYISCFIALTNQVADELVSSGISENRIFHVANGVDTTRFSLFKPDNNVFKIGFAGRFTTQKQVKKLVSYFDKSVNSNPIELQLIGKFDNTYGDVETFNIPPKVKLFSATHDIEPFYKQLDLYVSLSSEEGMPNSVLEAMASGKPLLLSNISGHRELVSDNGWLVRDEYEFKSALDAALQEWKSDKLYLKGVKSRLIVENEYEVKIISEKYLVKYLELLCDEKH